MYVHCAMCMYDVLQHNTCPICRKTLGTLAADAEEINVHEATDATDSNSSDSSDSDDDSDSSNEDANSSAINDSLPAADAAEDHIVDEPSDCVADDPDITVWDMRPDGSTTLSEIHQMEQDHHPRSRNSSSSSEYSSL